MSSSAQVAFNGLSGVPAGLISSSGQVAYSGLSGIPVGIISASSQVNYTQIQNQPTTIPTASFVNWTNVANRPNGLVSSSAQATLWSVASASLSQTASYFNGLVARFIPTTGQAQTEGSMWYDNTRKSLVYYDDVSVNNPIIIGQDTIVRVRNTTGVTIPRGSVVEFSSTQGGNILVRLAIAPLANSRPQDRFHFGLTRSDITNNSNGDVILFGELHDINTNAFPEGESLYVSHITSGSLILKANIPDEYALIRMAVVQNQGVGNGILFVAPDVVTQDWSELTNKPVGLVSSSAQINYTQIQNQPTTIPTASFVQWTNVANRPVGLVSASSQVTYGQLSGIPVGIVSSSGQVSFGGLSGVPAGLVSSSAQASTWTVATASFATLITSASYLSGSLSFTGGLVASSSAGNTYTSAEQALLNQIRATLIQVGLLSN